MGGGRTSPALGAKEDHGGGVTLCSFAAVVIFCSQVLQMRTSSVLSTVLSLPGSSVSLARESAIIVLMLLFVPMSRHAPKTPWLD